MQLLKFMYRKKFKKIYKAHYSLCDQILTHLENDETHSPMTFGENLLKEKRPQQIASGKTLERDGYIILQIPTDETKNPIFTLTGEGAFFQRLGGYKWKIKKEFLSKDASIAKDIALVIANVAVATIAGMALYKDANRNKGDIPQIQSRITTIESQLKNRQLLLDTAVPLKIRIYDTVRISSTKSK